MAAKPVLLALLLGAVCGGIAAWALAPAPAGADTHAASASAPGEGPGATAAPPLRVEPGETSPAATPPPGQPTLEGAPEAADNLRRLERSNDELKTRIAGLKDEVAALEPRAPDPKVLRFGLPDEGTPNFDKADWPNLAKNVLELGKLLKEIRDEVVAGGPPSPKSLQAAQTFNQPLAVFAVSIQGELGGVSPNVAFTHPAVVANLVRAGLLLAGDPLTPGQELALASLGASWVNQQDGVPVSATAPALAKLVAEVDAKIAYLNQVKALLTSSQRAALFEPETEGRLQLDLLSPALVYVLREPLGGTDRADLEEKLLASLFSQAGLKIEDRSPYAWVASRWLDEIPGALTPRSRTSEDVVFPHVDLVQAQARAQVQAIERILGMGRLEPAQAEALRGVTWLLAPYLQGGS